MRQPRTDDEPAIREVMDAILEVMAVGHLWNEGIPESSSALEYHRTFLWKVVKAAREHWANTPVESKGKGSLRLGDVEKIATRRSVARAMDHYLKARDESGVDAARAEAVFQAAVAIMNSDLQLREFEATSFQEIVDVVDDSWRDLEAVDKHHDEEALGKRSWITVRGGANDAAGLLLNDVTTLAQRQYYTAQKTLKARELDDDGSWPGTAEWPRQSTQELTRSVHGTELNRFQAAEQVAATILGLSEEELTDIKKRRDQRTASLRPFASSTRRRRLAERHDPNYSEDEFDHDDGAEPDPTD